MTALQLRPLLPPRLPLLPPSAPQELVKTLRPPPLQTPSAFETAPLLKTLRPPPPLRTPSAFQTAPLLKTRRTFLQVFQQSSSSSSKTLHIPSAFQTAPLLKTL